MSKRDRIVEARMKLRQRFKDRIAATPALADEAPFGTGHRNAHGMPKLPPGQTETHKWPVLDLGVKPDIAPGDWRLRFDGACDAPYDLALAGLLGLEQVEDVSDFHCVTAWSRFDIKWRGVRLGDLIAAAEPDDNAEFIMCHGYDGYTTNLSLDEALKPDVLVVHAADGAPLPREHGGPVRIITPQLYAWKGAKWIKRVELMVDDQLGFWEQRGYSNGAHPWRNDRYS